jgi:hypothetical protein
MKKHTSPRARRNALAFKVGSTLLPGSHETVTAAKQEEQVIATEAMKTVPDMNLGAL